MDYGTDPISSFVSAPPPGMGLLALTYAPGEIHTLPMEDLPQALHGGV